MGRFIAGRRIGEFQTATKRNEGNETARLTDFCFSFSFSCFGIVDFVISKNSIFSALSVPSNLPRTSTTIQTSSLSSQPGSNPPVFTSTRLSTPAGISPPSSTPSPTFPPLPRRPSPPTRLITPADSTNLEPGNSSVPSPPRSRSLILSGSSILISSRATFWWMRKGR